MTFRVSYTHCPIGVTIVQRLGCFWLGAAEGGAETKSPKRCAIVTRNVSILYVRNGHLGSMAPKAPSSPNDRYVRTVYYLYRSYVWFSFGCFFCSELPKAGPSKKAPNEIKRNSIYLGK